MPRKSFSSNANWLVKRGYELTQKEVRAGMASLKPWERVVYCLWFTDSAMRYGDDLTDVEILYPRFQDDARYYAGRLSLPLTHEAFSLPRARLQEEYFKRFEAMCEEVRRADPNPTPPG